MKLKTYLIIAIICYYFVTPTVNAQTPGTLDHSFGPSPGGTVMTGDVNLSSNDYRRPMTIQNDGKIVVAGVAGRNNEQFVIARYLCNGDLDGSFGTSGIVTIPVSFTDPDGNVYVGARWASSVLVQPDGLLLVAGQIFSPWSASRPADPHAPDLYAIMRFNSYGDLDASFGSGGKAIGAFSGFDMTPSVNVMKLQSDGKILLAGGSIGVEGGDLDFVIARFTPAGHLDATFQGGMVFVDFGGSDMAWDIATQSNDSIVVAGTSVGDLGSGQFQTNFAMIRLGPNGRLDNHFGSTPNGVVLTALPNSDDNSAGAYSIGLINDSIILGGFVKNPAPLYEDFAMARYDKNGNIDLNFGTVHTGFVITDLGIASSDEAWKVLIQKDHKIVLVGQTGGNTDNYFALVRYNSNGTQDNSFGPGGKTITEIGGYSWINIGPFSAALQCDGKIVVAGTGAGTSSISAPAYFELARYTSDIPTINYHHISVCQTSGPLLPVINAPSGGTFSSTPAGLALDATTGRIQPNLSAPLSYTITYTKTVSTCCNVTGIGHISIARCRVGPPPAPHFGACKDQQGRVVYVGQTIMKDGRMQTCVCDNGVAHLVDAAMATSQNGNPTPCGETPQNAKGKNKPQHH